MQIINSHTSFRNPHVSISDGLTRYIRPLVLAFYSLLHSTMLCEARQMYTARHYTTNDGLVANQCVELFTDSKGFAWIFTATGVSRFDGRHFTNFTTRDGLRENLISRITEDNDGHIWVQTATGISKYTGDYPKAFTTYVPQKLPQVIGSMSPTSGDTVFYNYQETPGIWFRVKNQEYMVRGYNERALDLRHDEHGYVYALSVPDKVTIMRGGRIVNSYRLPVKIDEFSHIAGLRPQQRLIRVRLHKRWLIYQLTPQGMEVDTSDNPPNLEQTEVYFHRGDYTNQIYFYSKNMVWMNRGNSWDTLFNSKLASGGIVSIAESHDGTIWLCTYNGLVRLTPDLSTQGKYIDPSHYLYTNKTGRTAFGAGDIVIRNKTALRFLQKLLKTISCTYVARDSSVWLCARDGLYRISEGGKVTAIHKPAGRYQAAIEDSQGNVWVNSYAGLICYTHGRFVEIGTGEGLAEHAIYQVAIDNKQTIYAGGASIFAKLANQSTFTNISGALNLPYEFALKMVAGPDGKVWLCQPRGKLYKINHADDGRFVIEDSLNLDVNGTEFLPSSIDFDGHDNLWVSGKQMIIYTPDAKGRYDAKRQVILAQQLNNSGYPFLVSNYKDTVSLCYSAPDGNSMNSYATSLLGTLRDKHQPRLYITALSLFRKKQQWATMGFKTDDLGIPKKPIFNSEQNFVTVNFTAIASNNPDAVEFRYRLLGLGDDWINTTSQFADFTNLNHGTYIFELQADDGSGRWSNSLRYPMKILPPWYLTWWAYTAAILLTAGVVGLIIYLRVRAVRVKARAEKLIVVEQLRALRAQINPHFLQNSFDFLAYQIGHASRDTAIEIIHQISSYLRNVLYLSDESVLTLEEELAFAEEYLRVQQLLMPYKFSYELIVDQDVDTYGVIVPAMLLQPLLENALKYGMQSSGQNRIIIKLHESDGCVHCTVADSGNPATPRSAVPGYRSKGMLLTVQRLELLYGKYKRKPVIRRAINEMGGWTIAIEIPLE